MTQRVAIAGAAGRLGSALVTAFDADMRFKISGILLKTTTRSFKVDIPVYHDPASLVATADVVIDACAPAQCQQLLPLCMNAGIPYLVAATALTAVDQQLLTTASCHIAVMHAPNLSVGAAVMQAAAALVAARLPLWPAHIVDRHHCHKRDAPSGTALALGATIAAAAAPTLSQGQLPPAVNYHSIRAGDLVGEHGVSWFGKSERLELIHTCHNRAVFAVGAVAVAWFLSQQPAGLYHMGDVVAG